MEAPVMLQRGKKRTLEESNGNIRRVYRFKILFPNNGTSVGLTLRDPKPCMPLKAFIELVRDEYFKAWRESKSVKEKKAINWRSESLYVEDENEDKISKMDFAKFKPDKCHILQLYDGSSEITDTFENMWDLTPDTELLMELPEEYTFETALADLIDNSLQAVWTNGEHDRRLISVDIAEDKISIFDTGPGMDGSGENSIVKWGKMGSSLHRASRGKAIGGKPPYLMPYFGMFGYGGPIASMHLGKCVSVSSKTQMSRKVYTLHLEREALVRCSDSQLNWRTTGGRRAPSKEEIEKSPHRSFMKVEILEPKLKSFGIYQLQCKLKDIYFPYIQCDEVSKTGKTMTPIEFKVNNVDLAEIEGGEVAITNLHSCNGPEFILELCFFLKQASATTGSPGPRACQKANARLRCLYFPVMEGVESIEKIIEKLKSEGYGVTENYETFSRISIRRLGRLLPDARWAWLPFMDLRQKKGEKAHLLKRCCLRVKCLIDTDAGFNPTPSKTDLALHNPFTTALKTFGANALKEENDIKVEIYRAGKLITPLQLEKDYQEWLLQMHDQYDEEICCGEDEPILIVNPTNKKALGIFSDVVRVHKVVKRKGKIWKSAQKIKILKGAYAKVHKNNVYATLEYFLIEGFQGDAGGEARIICRPIGLSDENGCVLAMNDEIASLDIRSSLSLPISIIDSGKCMHVDNIDWNRQLEKQRQKAPSMIDLLNANESRELGIVGVLPSYAVAGQVPPREIVAVVRPGSFIPSSVLKNLDQKYIVKDKLEMVMEIKFSAEPGSVQNFQESYPQRVSPSDCKGFQGLYIFPLRCRYPHLFEVAGTYTFSFYLIDPCCKIHKKQAEVQVKASSKIDKWSLFSTKKSSECSIKVGSFFPPLSIGCHDIYGNRTSFTSIPRVLIKLKTSKTLLLHEEKCKASLSANKSILKLEDILIASNELDMIRPHYKATLEISSLDDASLLVSIPCQVTPGSLNNITAQPSNWVKYLCQGSVVDKLKLEAFDAYGNHVKKGLEVEIFLDGFCFEDQKNLKCKVDNYGYIDLGGRLKVTAGYGKKGSLSVLYDCELVFKEEFKTEKRELRVVSGVPGSCIAGSQLENVVFEIVDSKGDIDVTIHDDDKAGQSHTLNIKSELISMEDSVRYAFRQGRCTVPAILVPLNEGCFCFVAAHSRFTELCLNIKVLVTQAPETESEEIGTPCSNGKILPLEGTPLSLEHGGNMMLSIMKNEKEISDDMCKYGLCIGKCEEFLTLLNNKKEEIGQVLYGLQASVEPNLLTDPSSSLSKDEMIRRIESRGTSAASVLCSFTREPTLHKRLDFMEDAVFLVALIGTVCTSKLSRILAEYLGEDHMLALVTRSFEAAETLENYKRNGEVDYLRALHAKAAELGKSIVGRFLILCLDDIRPYTGKIEDCDPQRWLDLPPPTLPGGPPGFMGYAVNMVNLDDQYEHIRTTSGYGLRETLLYRLFGELQVYRTREDMIEARAYIKQGAVSLDGGILKENGIISLGHWIPEICFPVSSGVDIPISPESLETLKQIEENKLIYADTMDKIEKYTKIREKAMKKFNKKKDKYNKFSDDVQLVMKDNFLEYKSNVKIENLP